LKNKINKENDKEKWGPIKMGNQTKLNQTPNDIIKKYIYNEKG
jgi:hypothetical protein